MAGLTAKQESACLKYLECGDKSEAYRHAYNTENMAPKTINNRAYELFDNGEIAGRVAELQAKIEKRTEITVDAVLAELAKIGFANTEDYIRVTPDGDPYIDLSSLTREQAAAISEVAVDDHVEGRGSDSRTIRKVRIKFHDKKGALVDIGKYLGMFPSKVEVGGPGGGPIQTFDIASLPKEERDALLKELWGE